MLNIPNSHIPYELLRRSETENDFNILIGENGSGKSTLLYELGKHFLDDNVNVIALANTIYDKFRFPRTKVKMLKVVEGRHLARRALINAFNLLASEDMKRMSNVASTLKFINFQPVISFRLKGIAPNARQIISDLKLPSEVDYTVTDYFARYVRPGNRTQQDNVTINFDPQRFSEFSRMNVLNLFLHEKVLRRAKVFREIELFLQREGKIIPLTEASSGELTMVATLVFLTVAISTETVVLIDEPENSLHPKWQSEYIRLLADLFYLYQPKFIIATHSPLILNGGEVNMKGLRVFKGRSGIFTRHSADSTNVEQIYQDVFDVTTPKNRFVSEQIVDKMNALAAREITLPDFRVFVDELRKGSYDQQQQQVLDEIMTMAEKIVNDTKSN